MSYDISLVDEMGNVMECEYPHKLTGGTIACDENFNQIPIRDAEINITYNYCKQYVNLWGNGSLYHFEGKRGKDIIVLLQGYVLKLGTDTTDNYWEATAGNAGKALEDLLFLCRQCPEGIIEIC